MELLVVEWSAQTLRERVLGLEQDSLPWFAQLWAGEAVL